MKKIRLSLSLIYKISFKLTFIVMCFIAASLLFFYFINSNIPDNNFNIPKDFAYIELGVSEVDEIISYAKDNDIEYALSYPILSGQAIDYPYENSFSLVVDNLTYRDGDGQVISDNEKLIYSGHRIKYFPISYLKIPTKLSQKNMNIPIKSTYIDKLVEGHFPQNNNQILIGETLANYYLEQYDLNSYNQLIGYDIPIKSKNCYDECISEEFEISGVYQMNDDMSINELENERVFIMPDKDNSFYQNVDANNNEGLFLFFDSKKDMKKFVDYSPYEPITYKTFKSRPYKLYFDLIFTILLNAILALILYLEIKKIKEVFLVHSISIFYMILIIGSPFILLNLLLSILMFNI